jgi:hypothetical protein
VKIRIRSLLAGAAALALATTLLVGGGSAAYAAVTPGWEPDANTLGPLTLYDANGNVITSGSLSSSPAIKYAAASSAGRTGTTLAQLKAVLPVQGVLPAQWQGIDTLTGSTAFPVTGAPASVASLTVPVATGAATDLSISTVMADFPNTSTVVGYQNLYELRLYDSGPGVSQQTKYWSADIQVNSTAGTWTVVFPAPAAATTTTLVGSPASPVTSGTAVALTATVSPATAGSVEFFDGTTDLGAGTYNATTGVATFTNTPAAGAHSYQAKFTSTNTGFTGSTSNTLAYSVGTPTSTTLAASPATSPTVGSTGTAPVTLTATVAPANTAGSVAFFDGTTNLGTGTYTQATGVATLAVNLTAATHLLVATFTPATGTTFNPSTSAVLSYMVLPSNFGTATIPLNATDNTQPFAGALTLQVTAGTAVALTQVDPTTAAGHPVQATDPTGHRHAWVFTGNLSGVSVNDTRPSQPGWTLTSQASNFANGATTVSAVDLGWTPAKVTTGSDAEGTVTAGSAIASQLAVATSNGLSSTSNFASAAVGSGLGTQNLSAGFELRIPDTSPTGSYVSTLTLTLISP